MKLLVIQICLLLILCTVAQAEFKENFDGKLSPLWEPIMGEWKLQEGNYNGKAIGTSPGFSLLPFEVADGMEIEVRGMDTAKGTWYNAHIVLSYVDESESYLAGSAILKGQWIIMRMSHAGWGGAGWSALTVTQTPTIRSNQWYSMSLKVDKNTVFFSVDGELKLEYTFRPELPKGRIGLGVSGSNALFDDFLIRGVDATPVNPRGRLATTWAKLKS